MEQRRQQIWPDVVAGGALVTRHDDNKYSTDFIIDHILKVGNRDGPAPLQIQNELAAQNGNRMLGNTSAGKQLESDLGEEITKMKKKLNDMRRERDATKEEIKAFEAKLCRVESQRMSLRNYAIRKYNDTIAKPLRSFLLEIVDMVEITNKKLDDTY